MTVPALTGFLALVYVCFYAFSFVLEIIFIVLATRLSLPVRLPGRKRATQSAALILGGHPTPHVDLIRLERRRQAREVSIFCSATLLTLASLVPLASVIALFNNIPVLGLEPTAGALDSDWAKFFSIIFALPLLNVIAIASLRGTMQHSEPSDALLWNSVARLMTNEDASRKTWRARAQGRTRLLEETSSKIRDDLSTLGMRDRRRRIDVDPSPLISSWKSNEADFPFAISTLDRHKVCDFLMLWAEGNWPPLIAQCEVSIARRATGGITAKLVSLTYAVMLAALPVGLLLAAKKLELSPELITSITGLASAPLVMSILIPIARRLHYGDPDRGSQEQTQADGASPTSTTTSPS